MTATTKKGPHISPRYATAAGNAADKAEEEYNAARRIAEDKFLQDRLKAHRTHAARIAELEELIRQARTKMNQEMTAAERTRDEAIGAAKRDVVAARTLRLEILDKFAETGNEDEAITQLESLAR